MPDATRDPAPVHPDDDQVVCYCMDVTTGMLHAAIDAGGWSVADLQDSTGACTGCGTCREDLLNMLAERHHEHPVVP